MPSLSDRIVREQSGIPEGMEPVPQAPVTQAPIAHFPPEKPMDPISTGITRCPIPPIYAQNPDNLRAWFNGGKVPQIRIYPQQLKGNS
jgi:hypothetical protein